MAQQELLQGVGLRPAQGAPRGIVGVVDDEHLGPVCDMLLQLLQGDAVAVAVGEAHRHGPAAGGLDDGGIRDPGRLQIHDLIPGIDEGADRQVDGELAAGGDHDAFGGIVAAVLFSFFTIRSRSSGSPAPTV